MNDMMMAINEQLRQLQMLMHRATYHSFMLGGRAHTTPHRGQGRVLALLKIKPEINQRDMTYLLGMSKQSIAELLTKLEKNGYITRGQSPEDKRVVTISLTEAGMKVADSMDDDEVESGQVLDCLSDEELAAFSDYLGRIIKRYEERFPGENFAKRRRSMEAFMSQYGHGRGFGGMGGRFGREDEDDR